MRAYQTERVENAIAFFAQCTSNVQGVSPPEEHFLVAQSLRRAGE